MKPAMLYIGAPEHGKKKILIGNFEKFTSEEGKEGYYRRVSFQKGEISFDVVAVYPADKRTEELKEMYVAGFLAALESK